MTEIDQARFFRAATMRAVHHRIQDAIALAGRSDNDTSDRDALLDLRAWAEGKAGYMSTDTNNKPFGEFVDIADVLRDPSRSKVPIDEILSRAADYIEWLRKQPMAVTQPAPAVDDGIIAEFSMVLASSLRNGAPLLEALGKIHRELHAIRLTISTEVTPIARIEKAAGIRKG